MECIHHWHILGKEFQKLCKAEKRRISAKE